MEKNIRYDTQKVHRVNLAIIAILAALICGPLIFLKGIIFLFVGLAVIALAICFDYLERRECNLNSLGGFYI